MFALLVACILHYKIGMSAIPGTHLYNIFFEMKSHNLLTIIFNVTALIINRYVRIQNFPIKKKPASS